MVAHDVVQERLPRHRVLGVDVVAAPAERDQLGDDVVEAVVDDRAVQFGRAKTHGGWDRRRRLV